MITNDGTFNENVYTKAVRTLATLKEAREKGNKRSERTAERALNALAVDYPVEVKKAGWDMSKWETEKHFVSWLRLCPDNRIRGDRVIGKGRLKTNNRLTIALKMAASTLLKSDSYLGAC